MEIEILNKEDFARRVNEATVRFTYAGVVYFNAKAVSVLELMAEGKKGYYSVHLCRNPKNKSEFGVFKDPSGYVLKPGASGGAKFYCAGLAQHIIDATWDRPGNWHGVGEEKPTTMVFRIASKPWDDDKNRDVFALLRRKE
jgi:hypothetical protein